MYKYYIITISRVFKNTNVRIFMEAVLKFVYLESVYHVRGFKTIMEIKYL